MTFPRLPFESVFADESGGNIKTPQGDYMAQGQYPIVDQGRELIGGYTNDADRICGQGRPAIVFGDHTRCVKYVGFPFCMGADGVKVLRPKIEADLKYLYYFLRSLHLPSAGYDRHFKYLKREQIVLPPLPEQRRIVTFLDTADAIKTQRKQALSELEVLAQAVFVEMFGDPATNSLNLPLAALGSLGVWSSGGTPPRGNASYFTGTLPWFSSGELETMYVSDSAEHISDLAIEETSAKRVAAGSLMLGMYDTAALKASIAAVDCSCNQAIAFCKLDPSVAEATYVYSAIVIGREHFRRLQRGVRQKNLNLSMIKDIQVPLPPVLRQREFTRRLHQIDSIRAIHCAALAESEELFASLQHRAFTGTL